MSNAPKQAEPSGDPSEPSELSDGPAPREIALVFAVSQEAGGLIDRLEDQVSTRGPHFAVFEGTFAGREIVVAVGGVGAKAAAQAAEALVLAHRPRWLISAGFAGGLSESIARDDVLIASEIIDGAGTTIAVPAPAEIAGEGVPLRFASGRLLTVLRVIATPEEKRKLHATYGAAAVDMESLAVARVAAERGTAFLSVRIISDAVDEALPSEVGNLLNQNSLAGRLGAVAGAIFKRPSSVKDLYRLKENALVSSDKLADFLAALLPRL